eukprot:gene3162-5905_t
MSSMHGVLIGAVVLVWTSTFVVAEIVGNSDTTENDSTWYSLKDLERFTGEDLDQPILMAIKGVVFDVSEGRRFYGPGAPYHVLAGKDCTRAVGLWSLEERDLTSDISDFTEEQLSSLNEDSLQLVYQVFDKVYKAKYPIVGRVAEEEHDEL